MNTQFLKGGKAEGLLWFVLGIILSIESIELKLGNLHKPGPGFVPFLSGVVLVVLGLFLLFSHILGKIKLESNVKEIIAKENLKKLLFTFLILLGYIIAFEPLGFFLSTFLFFFLLFKLTEPKRWLMPSFISGTSVLLSYLIFCIWLRCPLPKGIFKF